MSVDLVDPPSHRTLALPGELLVGLLLRGGVVWEPGDTKRTQGTQKGHGTRRGHGEDTVKSQRLHKHTHA